eukprot:13862307-Heterocapsa_arctica.AAC.1
MGGRTSDAQEQSEKLHRAVYTGVKEQLRDDERTRRTSMDQDKVRADAKCMTLQAGRSGGTDDVKELNGQMRCEDVVEEK